MANGSEGTGGRAPRSALADVESYWRQLKEQTFDLPHRDDLDPGRIASALPQVFVLELAAPGVARLQIAGRALSELLGTEARGLPLSVLFTPSSRDALGRWVRKCVDSPAVVELTAEAKGGVFQKPLSARLLFLPMLDRHGAVRHILGCLETAGPKRSGVVKLELDERPSRIQLLPPGLPASWTPPPTQRAMELAESPRPFLRLVVDND